MQTDKLIPTNGIYVTETYGPPGWQAARYDARGFALSPRWFKTRDKAEAWAKKLGEDCGCGSGQICEVCDPELLAKYEDDPLQGTDRHR